MKIKSNVILIGLATAMMLVSLSACDTRPIPGDLILSTYNSDMEVTKKFSPMDTLYIKLAGVTPSEFYQISALDADGRLIAKIEARTDEDGVLGVVPLWYDIGLKSNGAGYPPYIDSYGDLTPLGFKVNVKSLYDDGDSTDFTQDMFIVYGKMTTDTNPKPVVYSCYSPDYDEVTYTHLYPENAFKEAGTIDADGEKDLKTFVFVKAERIPSKIGNDVDVTEVDFYVLPFTGAPFQNDDALDGSVVGPITVTVTNGTAETLLWDINTSDVVNPTEDTMAYSIVMDVDQDGVYDEGIDTDSDGVSDYFIDGVDGNGVPGFIIQNTPANDIFVTIKDGTDDAANIVNSIVEDSDQALYIDIDNIPVASDQPIGIFLISNFSGTNLAALTGGIDIRQGNARGGDRGIAVSEPNTAIPGEIRYLPYLEDQPLFNDLASANNWTFFDTATALTDDLSFDLIVDMNNDGLFNLNEDYFIEDAVVMFMAPANPIYATCSDAGGTTQTPYFDESNSEGNTIVYLNAADAPDLYDVYVIPGSDAENVGDQDSLSAVSLFSVTGIAGGADTDLTNPIWDLDGTYKVINPSIENNTYYIVIDEDQDGLFDDGADEVLTIVILNTNANSYPRVTYVNIASGGNFLNTYAEHWTLYSENCEYKDVFAANGLDTSPYGGGYGVKAVFNPYFSWFYNPDPQTPVAGLYYGLYVDVYIVNANPDSTSYFDLSDYGHAGELNDNIDVTGRHSTLVVQPSCYNGAGMMTIWPAQMRPGTYFVIVDVNRNGRIDEGTDIIDAVNQAGETIIDDATIVGFTVE